MEDTKVIVLDPGSATTKAGLAGDLLPGLVFPTVVSGTLNSVLIGEEAFQDDQYLRYPIQGMSRDWDSLEHILDFPFKHYKVLPSDTPMLIAEPMYSTRTNSEKLAQIMFEKFEICALYTTPSCKLSLYAAGKYDGLVVECGDQINRIIPIIGGYSMHMNPNLQPVAGRELTERTLQKLSEKGITVSFSTAQDIKEKLGCVDPEDQTLSSIDYQLPDGNKISVGSERFDFLEPLFDAENGIHKVLTQFSHEKWEDQEREALWNNIVLSGGTTLTTGMSKRLKKELSQFGIAQCNIFENPERLYNTWIGGSIFASLNYFFQTCWSKEEYDETGPGIVRPRTCCA